MLWSEPWATPLALRHPAQQHWQHNPWLQQQQQQQQRRAFAAAKGEGAEGDEAAAAAGGGGGGAEEADAAGEGAGEGEAPPSVEHLTAELQERERAVEELQAKVNDLADSFKRSLAEMENLRQRTAREVDTARRFAAEPVIKAMLDVADNLQRAAEAVPAAALDGSEPLDADKARALLASLLEGVRMTEGVLMGAFRRHGVEQYDPAGEKFDPNLHQAMFEVPDATKEAGVVAVVTKVCDAFSGRGGMEGRVALGAARVRVLSAY